MDRADTAVPMRRRIRDENVVLRNILEGTATVTGKHFFRALVETLAKTLQTYSAWVTEYVAASRQLHALAYYANGEISEDFYIDVDGTPCQKVIESTEIIHYPDNVFRLYPQNATFTELHARSYLGIPLLDEAGRILGNLAVFDTRPMPGEPHLLVVLKIFAARAAAELLRLNAEAEVRTSEEKFRRIIATTGEGFVLMDKDLVIAEANEAFCRMIGYGMPEIIGRSPLDLATEGFRQFLKVNMPRMFIDQHKEFEGTLQSKSGRRIPVRIYGDILKNDRGETIGYMHFVSDLTRQKRSLLLAAEVQKNLLPQTSPRVKGYDIAGRTLSCDEIGGDYFDYWPDAERADERVTVVVGDVAGHGAEAALLMTTARAIFRLEASQSDDMAGIIDAMNRQLAHDVLDSGRFMTLFCLELDTRNRQPRWIRAGHPPALLYSPDRDRFEELRGDGMALGVDAAYRYHLYRTRPLTSGQIIAIGTDGVWEAFDRTDNRFGMQAFRRVIRRNAHRSATAILEAVYEDLQHFTYGTKPKDDISLVIVKVAATAPMDWSI